MPLDPRFVMPIFRAAFTAGVTYLDMAMSLSHPHPTDPYRTPGVKLGDEQFAMAAQWEERGLMALCGMGVEPGLSDVFARYAADKLFSSIDEIGVRDGANLVIEGYDFAPSFSIWTTIEECLNPPVVWEKGRDWFTTECFSEPETFVFPAGIGPVECVNVEHEEVLLIPRWVDAQRVTFKYGLGDEFIGVLADDPQARARFHDPDPSRQRRGLALGTSSPRACPTRRRSGDRMYGTDVRRHLGHRQGEGREPSGGLPPPCGRQRLVHARVRIPGGGLADGHEPRRGPGADRLRRLVGPGRPGPGGAAGRALPRPAQQPRGHLGLRRAHPHVA